MGEFQPIHLIGALVLVALNGFFVASEFAVVKVRRTRLVEMQESGDKRAKTALHIVSNLNAYLTANQLGITLASLGLGWIGEPAVASAIAPLLLSLGLGADVVLIHSIATVIAFMIVMTLHTVLGELVPKSLAILDSERLTLLCARPLHGFYILAYPLIYVLNGAANVLVRLLGHDPDAVDEEAHSVEELRMVVWAVRRGGDIEASTEKLLTNLLDYQDRTARELMTPRNEVVFINPEAPLDESLATMCSADYTRFPVYDQENQKIHGYIHLKDVVKSLWSEDKVEDLEALVREPTIVPESLPADKIRLRMQNTHTHLAFVVDEFGDLAGILTMEDILEEIVGQIQDEIDRESPEITRLGKDSWLVDAGILLETAERELGLSLKPYPEGMDTLAGFILTRLGRVAAEGDTVQTDNHILHVVKVENLRILTVKIEAKANH